VTNALTSGRTQSFTYDNLNRIVTAKSSATSGTYCWGQSIPTDGTGYDRYGNLLKINTSQCSAPALNVSVNAYNQITNSGYTYDATGDMLTDGTNTYTWNGEGLLKSAASVNYTYDGDMKRVEKSSGTYYWFSPSGTPLAETDASGNTQNEYIYFSAGRTARRDSAGNVYYYFSDPIGTAQLITNSTGTVCYDSNKTPFGYEMAYTTTCAQNYMFAGMERDTETGNDHTWFRGYEQNLGRWMSPDLLGGDVSNPQSLNRYAYVLNNPTSMTDPLGLQSPGENCSGKTGSSLIDCVTGVYCMSDPGQCSNRELYGMQGPFDEFDWSGIPVVQQTGYDWIPFEVFGQSWSGSSPIGQFQAWLISGYYWGPIFEYVTDFFMIVSSPQYLYSQPQGSNPSSESYVGPQSPPLPHQPPTPAEKAQMVQSCEQNPDLFLDNLKGNTNVNYALQAAFLKEQPEDREAPVNNPETANEIFGIAGPAAWAANAPDCIKAVNNLK
jgi:RHS repeat-associated protein